jgi:nucleotide-binding universal stress UspA family protein
MVDMTTKNPRSPTPTAAPGQSGENRIVVGVDGSDCATRALDFALHEAALRGALLRVVSIYEMPPSTGWAVVSPEPFEDLAEANVAKALTRVHQLDPTVVTKGDSHLGFAGTALVEASGGAQLLVVGSRGHGNLTNLFIGSVSEHCVHHAGCPVTVVR